MTYIDTHSTDASFNFGVEKYFSLHPADDDICLIWRTSPTLMIGKFQNTVEEIDAEYARLRGIKVVRRESGGGTIYTDAGGWQYSFITKADGLGIEFDRFIVPVVSALRSLGLDAEATGRNDITVAGRKVSGNAQYRTKGMVVHHGSLLFDTDIDELVRASTPKPYKITSKAVASVRERVTNIREHLASDMTGPEFRDYLVSKITDRERELTDCEASEAGTLAGWFDDPAVLYSSPKFEIDKTIHTPGGTYELTYSVHRGVITEIHAGGDFFGGEGLEEALRGCIYTPDKVRTALESLGNSLFMTDSEEFVRCLFE